MNFYYVNDVIISIHRRSHAISNFRVIIDLIIQFLFFYSLFTTFKHQHRTIYFLLYFYIQFKQIELSICITYSSLLTIKTKMFKQYFIRFNIVVSRNKFVY